jgi:hypothetical protein
MFLDDAIPGKFRFNAQLGFSTGLLNLAWMRDEPF